MSKGPLMLRFAVARRALAQDWAVSCGMLPPRLAYCWFGWRFRAGPSGFRRCARMGAGPCQAPSGLAAPMGVAGAVSCKALLACPRRVAEFLNALKLERSTVSFVTISCSFFGHGGWCKIPLLTALGILTAERFFG